MILHMARIHIALKLTKNCYLYYNINIFLENWYFDNKLVPPLSRHMLYILRDYPHNLKNMKARGLQESQFSNTWVNWKKFGPAAYKLFTKSKILSLLWTGKNLEVYTVQKHFKIQIWIYGWIGKIYALI